MLMCIWHALQVSQVVSQVFSAYALQGGHVSGETRQCAEDQWRILALPFLE